VLRGESRPSPLKCADKITDRVHARQLTSTNSGNLGGSRGFLDQFGLKPFDEAVQFSHLGGRRNVPLNALYALVREIRGASIDQTIWLDLLVTDILANFFCSDKERRAVVSSEVLTGRDATFSGRLDVLEKTTKASFPEFAATRAALFGQLGKVRRFRNRLAHAHVDTSDAFLSKGYTDRIQLVFHEGGVEKTHVITIEEFRERLSEGSQAMLALLELQGLVAAAT
jgi:hypothetical protein